MSKKISFTLQELAKLAHAEVKGDPQAVITSLASITSARAGDLTYLIGGPYKKYLADSQATAVLLTKDNADECPVNALIVKHPELSFARIAELFIPPAKNKVGVHPSTIVGVGCLIDPTVTIEGHCVIGNRVVIGPETVIKAGCMIGDDTQIGSRCLLNNRVTVYSNIIIQNKVIIHSGSVIGADGFGYTRDDQGWVKIPQLGSVLIEDNVEIGALSAIDRGALSDTIIRKGVKIDNCVQIAHNVEIGENTIIAGCAGIAGSVKIGKNCMIGGGACLNGHITLCDDVIVTGAATVFRSIEESGIYTSGIDARPHREWGRTVARIHRLDELAKQMKSSKERS